MNPRDDRSAPRRAVAIALVSAAVILLEILFTRVLSVVLWYHFAFLAVSLAMLGLGAPAAWFAVKPPGERALKASLIAAAFAVPAGLAGVVKVGALLPSVTGTVTGALDLAPARVILTVACTLAPLLALGSAVVVLLIGATGREFGRLYAADLAGAAAGAAVAVPLMHVVSTPVLIAACGFLPAAAAIILVRPVPRAVLVAGALLAGLIAWGEPFRLHYTKTYTEADVLWERWTPTARITIFPKPFWRTDPGAAFGWGMGSKFVPFPLEQLWVEQDGSAGTPITRLDGDPRALEHLFFDVTSAAYQMRPPRSVAVIGAGGGRDVLTALAAGATSIDAVELNGAIIEALTGPFRDLSGDVYHRPGVTAHVAEGRNFLTRTDRRWDLVQVSLIDSWAATAAGAYALAENNLYTVEAVRLYLRRLTPAGLVSISRWTRVATQLEVPRLVLLVEKALELEGVRNPEAHIAVVEGRAVATVMASPSPIGPQDLARLDAACEARGFVRHWPLGPTTPPKSFIASVLLAGPATFTELGFDLTPPTDDRPFFFQMLPVFGRVEPEIRKNLSMNDSAVVTLRWLMAFVGAVSVILFALPLFAARRIAKGGGLWRGGLYFAAIGIAFLLVEVALIQRFILYLGHPSHATTVVLAAVLIGAGAGSLAATRARSATVDRWKYGLPAIVVAQAAALPVLFGTTIGWPFAARLGMSLVVVAGPSFLMGFAFPVGLDRFGEDGKAWFWAINGVTGVLAGVASLALAMTVGFGGVLGTGAALYAAACLLLPSARTIR